MLNIVIVVEDKQDQQMAALEAIKLAAGPVEELSPSLFSLFGIVGLKSLNGDGGTQVLFAADLESAMHKIECALREHQAKIGVITDLMLPQRKGGKEEPNGLTTRVASTNPLGHICSGGYFLWLCGTMRELF